MKTLRLKLTIGYDGRAFRGWQSQPTGDAVEDHLERVVAEICGARHVVHGSGRTDAGVHALAQIAHVDVPADLIPLRQWAAALNSQLPPEVRVLRVQRARPDFHARFDAVGKTYLYRIWNARCLHPLEIGRAWFMPSRVNLALLREGARRLEGTHDFASFAANRRQKENNTIRTVHRIRVAKQGPLITLRVDGSGFLYHMVRLIAGTLIRCAQGREPIEWIDELLKSKGAAKSSFAAPAEGLYLVRVLY